MGFPSVRHLIERAKEFFAGTISADEFLRECDHEAIGIVIDAVEQLFESRTSALRGLSGDAKLTFEPYQATMSPREQELVSEGS
jgi:hypothetical protein